ncbi:MAG TPA: L,D-transpeptidase family protein [Stellaceae bacterium]|nr:L,D-transpeptidase family protein [Stellaceae bacterium]
MTSAQRALGCALATAVVALLTAPAMAADFVVAPDTKAVGQVQTYVVQQGDNFADIARKFDIGYTEMMAANPGVAPWTPPVGQTLYIPSLYILPNAPRQGIVIDLGERRLYYFPRDGAMQTYPIGIGAIGFDTPHATTKVVRKEPNPVWIPPPSIRAEQPDLPAQIGPGPDDPLGDYALRLGWPNYLIHGTNKPDGVGRNVSHGCIHLYPEDIQKLFNSVAVGTPVRVIDQPVQAAWIQGGLYVEAHPSKDQADQIDTEQAMTPDPPTGLRETVSAAAGDAAQAVDWNTVDQIGVQRTGLPVEVAQGAPSGPAGEPVASAPAQDNVAVDAATSVPDVTPASAPVPIFGTLQPPPGMAPQGPQDASMPEAPGYDTPQTGYGDAATASQVPADQGVEDLQALKAAPAATPPASYAAPDAAPANSPDTDPNAAYNAQFKN